MNKEIYFSSDVYKEVAKKLKLSPKVVEKLFTSFLKSYKDNLLKTDEIIYLLPYLGEMMISKGDCSREINKLKTRYYREKDPAKKEEIASYIENYRVRLKKIKIEVEKMKHNRTFLDKRQKNRMLTRKQGLTTPENTKRKNLMLGTTLEEAIKKQNEYAYKHYDKFNLSVTL